MSSKNKTTATNEEAKPALVPKLRFAAFRGTGGWTEKPLKAAAAINPSNNGLPESFIYIDLESVDAGKLKAKSRISRIGAPSRAQRLVERGDIIYQVVRPYQRNNLLCEFDDHDDYVASTGYAQLRAIGSNRFLYQSIHTDSFVGRVIAKCTGSNYPAINSSDLADIELPLPPTLAEQQKIAECLSSVDEVIAAQAQKVDALKTHKKGLMQQLFPREGETQPRLRFPEFRNDGDWLLTTVGGLVETGCLFPPKDGNHGNIHPKSSDYVARGVPFIMASDLNGGLIDIENCHFISKEQADTLQKGFAKEGDVLLSHKGTVGEVAVVRHINTPYLMLTPQVTYYRVKDRKKLSNEFLAQLFVADAFQSNLVEVSGGGTRAYIGITEQVKLRVQLPEDVTEQQRIVDCLSSLDALITAVTKNLEALKFHKRGLMQQLFPSPQEAEA